MILIFIVVLRGFNGGEDNWIKDSKGIWIKHGNPASMPDYVREQLNLISCSRSLFETARVSGMRFNSQCLGRCIDYSVDVVNVLRNSEDNLVENQCSDYRQGITKHFIELDKNGEIVKIVE